jgi:hypothetical protein
MRIEKITFNNSEAIMTGGYLLDYSADFNIAYRPKRRFLLISK